MNPSSYYNAKSISLFLCSLEDIDPSTDKGSFKVIDSSKASGSIMDSFLENILIKDEFMVGLLGT